MVERLAFIVDTCAITRPAWRHALTVPADTPSRLAHPVEVSMPGLLAEPLLPVMEPVFVADVADDQGVEGSAFAAGGPGGR